MRHTLQAILNLAVDHHLESDFPMQSAVVSQQIPSQNQQISL